MNKLPWFNVPNGYRLDNGIGIPENTMEYYNLQNALKNSPPEERQYLLDAIRLNQNRLGAADKFKYRSEMDYLQSIGVNRKKTPWDK